MKKITLILFALISTQFAGCIIFNNVSYEVSMNEDGTGSVLVVIDDINSDATTKEELDTDIKNVLEYGYKSADFIDENNKEGKRITNRNLVVENGKLNAIVRYDFDDVSKVEGMQYDDPYYYLTIAPDDSIISTNGQVTKTKEYQRIIWDKSMKTLKFKMYSDDTNKDGLTSLAPYYLKEK
jgi:hypothetical protein